jgi:hypothetical protein
MAQVHDPLEQWSVHTQRPQPWCLQQLLCLALLWIPAASPLGCSLPAACGCLAMSATLAVPETLPCVAWPAVNNQHVKQLLRGLVL